MAGPRFGPCVVIVVRSARLVGRTERNKVRLVCCYHLSHLRPAVATWVSKGPRPKHRDPTLHGISITKNAARPSVNISEIPVCRDSLPRTLLQRRPLWHHRASTRAIARAPLISKRDRSRHGSCNLESLSSSLLAAVAWNYSRLRRRPLRHGNMVPDVACGTRIGVQREQG